MPSIYRDILDVATPALRPPWIGRKIILSEDEALALGMAKEAMDRLHYRVLYEVFGERAWYLLKRLRDRGEIEHVAYDFWRITELGREVLAAYFKQTPSRS